MDLTAIILGITNIALLVALFFKDKAQKEERNQFITALLSKKPEEYAVANKIIEQKPPKNAKTSDLVPEVELTDEEFFKAIEKTNN